MSALGDERLQNRLANEWGSFGQSSQEIQHQIRKLTQEYESAPLWAYSAQAGAAHFKKLCATCHLPNQKDESLAPKLAGSGSKGIGYLVENVLDPNAVIGRDFQAQLIATVDGRVFTGLVVDENDSAITIRTATDNVTIQRDDIGVLKVSKNSFMPTDLLKTLNDRERIELFKYLMSL